MDRWVGIFMLGKDIESLVWSRLVYVQSFSPWLQFVPKDIIWVILLPDCVKPETPETADDSSSMPSENNEPYPQCPHVPSALHTLVGARKQSRSLKISRRPTPFTESPGTGHHGCWQNEYFSEAGILYKDFAGVSSHFFSPSLWPKLRGNEKKQHSIIIRYLKENPFCLWHPLRVHLAWLRSPGVILKHHLATVGPEATTPGEFATQEADRNTDSNVRQSVWTSRDAYCIMLLPSAAFKQNLDWCFLVSWAKSITLLLCHPSPEFAQRRIHFHSKAAARAWLADGCLHDCGGRNIIRNVPKTQKRTEIPAVFPLRKR